MEQQMAEYQRYMEERLVDINSASREELLNLPYIDSNLADQIIENRPYSGPEDLLEIKGIGNLMVEELSPFLMFGETEKSESEVPQ